MNNISSASSLIKYNYNKINKLKYSYESYVRKNNINKLIFKAFFLS